MSARQMSSFSLFVIGFVMLSLLPVQAQSTCPALVEQALTALGNNCSGLDRNSACYGYDHVEATFSEEVAPDFFTRPAQRTGLTILSTVSTAPLDLALEQWGIAVLNVQANVPNTLPGQAVTVLLLGDVTVENRVEATSAALPAEPITLITQSATDMLAAPDAAATIVASIPGGAVIEADAISPDGAWVRVFYEGNPGWISTSAVSITERVTSLPLLSVDRLGSSVRTYFSTRWSTAWPREPATFSVLSARVSL